MQYGAGSRMRPANPHIERMKRAAGHVAATRIGGVSESARTIPAGAPRLVVTPSDLSTGHQQPESMPHPLQREQKQRKTNNAPELAPGRCAIRLG